MGNLKGEGSPEPKSLDTSALDCLTVLVLKTGTMTFGDSLSYCFQSLRLVCSSSHELLLGDDELASRD
jgi:hypothetical protein